MVGAPKHPDFVFPAVPEGPEPELASRIDRGWQYLQLDDHRNAEREFAAALKQQPSFHPAETGMAYLALARGNERDASTRFEKALQGDAGYVPALIGRGRRCSSSIATRTRSPASRRHWRRTHRSPTFAAGSMC